jgi:hypothetical protein
MLIRSRLYSTSRQRFVIPSLLFFPVAVCESVESFRRHSTVTHSSRKIQICRLSYNHSLIVLITLIVFILHILGWNLHKQTARSTFFFVWSRRRGDGRQVITSLFRGYDTWSRLIITLILFGLASGLNFSGGGVVTAVSSYSLGVAGGLNFFWGYCNL